MWFLYFLYLFGSVSFCAGSLTGSLGHRSSAKMHLFLAHLTTSVPRVAKTMINRKGREENKYTEEKTMTISINNMICKRIIQSLTSYIA